MATLPPYFERGTKSGWVEIINTDLLGNVGEVKIKDFGPFIFSCDGAYNALGHSGKIEIDVLLTDHNANSETGPCKIKVKIEGLLHISDPNATYKKYKSFWGKPGLALVTKDKKNTLKFELADDKRRTWAHYKGSYDIIFHLVPEGHKLTGEEVIEPEDAVPV